MKRLAIILLLSSVGALPAGASPELASAWGEKAAELYDQTISIRDGAPVSDRFTDELARFSVTASRLASWIDSENGPSDLGCIFRGMAGESETQLDALETGNRANALQRLTLMFSDAELVSAASIQAIRRDAPDAGKQSASCAARPLSHDQYFTDLP